AAARPRAPCRPPCRPGPRSPGNLWTAAAVPWPWFAETDWSAATGRGAGTAGSSAGAAADAGASRAGIAWSDIALSDIALLSLAPTGATPPEDGPSGVLSDPDGAAPARAIPANGPSATDPDCPASADAIPE